MRSNVFRFETMHHNRAGLCLLTDGQIVMIYLYIEQRLCLTNFTIRETDFKTDCYG